MASAGGRSERPPLPADLAALDAGDELEPVYLNRDFRVLWLARTLGQIAAQAAQFGTLILIIEGTNSGLHASLLVLTWVLPQAIVGLVSGVVVDAVSKRWLLAVANALRAFACFAFITSSQGTEQIYEVVIALSVLGPFIGPAESALVPTLVGRKQLTSANAFLNLLRYAAQVAGLAILAPVLIRTSGVDALFVVMGMLFAAAAIYAALIPSAPGRRDPVFPDEAARGRRGSLAVALRYVRADRDVFRATIQLSLLSATLPLLAALLPVFLTGVLDQRVSDLPVVLAPTVIGMLLGLRLVSSFARRRDPAWIGAIGLALFIVGLELLAFIEPLQAAIGGTLGFGDTGLGPLPDLTAEAQLVMVIAFPLGFAFSLVSVAANAVLNTCVPLRMQGRVFALQVALAAVASVPPLIVGGALVEVIDVRIVFGLTPLLLAWAWAYGQWGVADPVAPLRRRLARRGAP